MTQENIFIRNKTISPANGLMINKQEKQILSKQQQYTCFSNTRNTSRCKSSPCFLISLKALINVDREKQLTQATIRDITKSIGRLKGNDKEALAEVKQIIEVQQHYSKYDKDFAGFYI